MTSKIALLMFAAIVLLTSTAIMIVPQASALTTATVRNYIATATHGSSNICGDHKCAPGEHTQWYNAVWQSQKGINGKIPKDTLGEDVMAQLAVSTPAPTKNP
ncbi:hypothetical protein [Candidatus Nitrosotalea bavarica]|uniref:hypothetical protein n=1 Tax=Candidatus Nitrosotalea bavarica TaxID=1903277 RepID=UPI000C712B71|nr:hypothetical protein [Candidatus Nitrosotalea bavarica]